MKLFLQLRLTLIFLSSFNLNSQIIFQETFNEPNDATVGSANGINWSSSCPTCLTGDYWKVNSGVFEGKDTNGEAEWITDNPIDVSNCDFIEISFDIQSQGTMEACGTGCNSVDWVGFQYNMGGTWIDPSNSYFCAGSCAGVNVIASGDASTTYSTGCISVNGNDLQLKIAVQCWAAAELWKIDNITVTCSSPNTGTNGNLTICSSASSVNLFDQLGGNPNNGGTWTGPSILTGGDLGTFNPSTMTSGNYTYSIGTAPCQNSSNVTIIITNSNNAGNSDTVNLCSNSTSLNLFDQLGGNPNNGGTWTGPSNLTGGNLGTFNPTTMSSGDYTYTVGITPCISSAIITVNINPVDNASFTFSDYCENDTPTITITGLIGGTFAFNPIPTNGATIDPLTGVITNGIGGSSYSVQYSTNGSCPQSNIQTISIYSLPNLITNNSSICEGDSIELNVNGSLTYIWDNNLGVGQNHFVSPTTTTIYTVTGTNAQSCQNSNQSTITVNPLPIVDAGIDQTICDGDLITLNASSGNTYNWNNGITDGVPFSPTNDATYIVTGIDLNGCKNTDSLFINIEQLPIPTFLSNDLSGCLPFTTSFYNNTIGNYTNCSWTINGDVLYSCDSVEYTFNNADLYDISLSLESTNGCTGTSTYSNYIFVEENPVADFSYVPIETNSEVSFLNESEGSSIYIWTFGDGNQSTEFEPIHEYNFSNSNSYTISLVAISDNGCIDSTQKTITSTESLIYYIPNSFTPDGNEFNNTFTPIFTEGIDPFDYQLSIYNRWGELIFVSRDSTIGWDGTHNNTLQMNDTYIWKIDFKRVNSGGHISETGHVNLIK